MKIRERHGKECLVDSLTASFCPQPLFPQLCASRISSVKLPNSQNFLSMFRFSPLSSVVTSPAVFKRRSCAFQNFPQLRKLELEVTCTLGQVPPIAGRKPFSPALSHSSAPYFANLPFPPLLQLSLYKQSCYLNSSLMSGDF